MLRVKPTLRLIAWKGVPPAEQSQPAKPPPLTVAPMAGRLQGSR
jgi:hypothetical protein